MLLDTYYAQNYAGIIGWCLGVYMMRRISGFKMSATKLDGRMKRNTTTNIK